MLNVNQKVTPPTLWYANYVNYTFDKAWLVISLGGHLMNV